MPRCCSILVAEYVWLKMYPNKHTRHRSLSWKFKNEMCFTWMHESEVCMGLTNPQDLPHRALQRPAAGRGASLCLPFVMRCHLALAVQSLLSSPSATHHKYDNTFTAFSLHIGWRQTPPECIFWFTAASHWLCAAQRPLLFLSESIHINEAGLYVFPTSACGIVELLEQEGGL